MSNIDWVILLGTLSFIVGYGVYKTRGSKNIEGYLKGDNSMKWWTVGLSVMATQASAITFLSTPGQAFEDGMRFVQFYFGLPIAMIIISVTFIPIYYRLKVYTAYEYLESRFDLKTRTLAAILFLIQRGLAAGITIYAPAIILSTILNWNLNLTIIVIGTLVIIYTVSGGTKAVSQTQKQQMAIMMGGMVIAAFVIIDMLPEDVSFGNAMDVAGHMGRLNVVTFDLDFSDRYNVWSGITGGMFLALSYFGTDQSQVQRYLSSKSIAQSRLGLLMNGLLKVPMQFLILFVGVLVFVFYQFYQPPVFFNDAVSRQVAQTEYANEWQALEEKHSQTFEKKREEINAFLQASEAGDETELTAMKEEVNRLNEEQMQIQGEVKELVGRAIPLAETKDTDYVFISFIMQHFPTGLIGLLLAVIFSAAMSSTASELNALGSTSVVDLYKRSFKQEASDQHYLNASRFFTLLWGVIAIVFATFASLADNLIEFVNIIGSIFYGTILGIFLVAFYIKYVKSNAIFIAACIAEATVLYLFFTTDIGFLWFNVIGCALVVAIAMLIEMFMGKNKAKS
ncbi:sodium:solute symporter family transporter [Catalinimonas niigatensis]|uniref:sodium:solute symporter family transporter n=1 Tax=Catalinimonas niigatensis TaxID=1397264 RepID=UPI0026671129|nr:sodium:solute symporter [Catalinimonas niigatensis]WPP49555.1 sodium:solute symporter [Catalinimonas niigatensis]